METKSSRHKKKKKLGSFPYISVIFSITLALFVIGLFGLLVLHSNRIKDSIRENITVQLYLDKSVTENDIIRLNKILTQKPYIHKAGDNISVEFISKEDAAKVFIESTGEDFIEFLGDNPLRDAFSIKIDASYQLVDSLQKIKAELNDIDSVFEVVYVQNLVQSINNNITKISLILIGFTLIMLLTIVVLINNTIKLALFSQRFLIRSMQLVGAKAGFIISPFVKRAGIHGFISGIIAIALLFGLLSYANSVVEELKQLQSRNEIVILFAFILALGSILGMTSTYRAVKKYLKLSLDELY